MAEKETSDPWTVVCPWCDHRHSDGWEMVDFNREDYKLGECARCEKPIRYRVEVSHTYYCEQVTS